MSSLHIRLNDVSWGSFHLKSDLWTGCYRWLCHTYSVQTELDPIKPTLGLKRPHCQSGLRGFLFVDPSQALCSPRDLAERPWQWALSEPWHRSNNQPFVSGGVGRHTELQPPIQAALPLLLGNVSCSQTHKVTAAAGDFVLIPTLTHFNTLSADVYYMMLCPNISSSLGKGGAGGFFVELSFRISPLINVVLFRFNKTRHAC